MPEEKTAKLRRVPATEQSKNQLYEMSLKFTASAGLKSLDDMLSSAFPDEGLPRLKDAVTIRMRQVLPVVPDDEMIQAYAETIRKAYSERDTTLHDIRFDGYDYLRVVEDENNEKNETGGDADGMLERDVHADKAADPVG